MPAGGRFGPQGLGGPFPHMQQNHLPHHANQHHPPGSAGLPQPSFHSNPGFGHGNQSSAMNAFTGVNNVNGLAAGFGGGPLGGGTGLGSSEAIRSFAHGALLQQQQQSKDAMRRGSNPTKSQQKTRIREVWQSNLHQEMQNLRELVDRYPYISMDTEFPGVIARPMGSFTSRADYHYQTLRANVDLLSVIQLGITLFGPDGESPPAYTEDGPYPPNLAPCPHTWQFNFKFNSDTDMYNQESIDFLMSVGMNMEAHEIQGIDPREFGSLLITSGLVCSPNVRWVSFHSGYDFAYLVKLMFCKPLPEDEVEYRKILTIFFPSIYDIKYMVKSAQRTQTINGHTPLPQSGVSLLASLGPKSGLQDLADELNVKRVGPAHQAGSDSLLTGKVFWDVKKTIFNGTIDDEKYIGQVWGLNGLIPMQPSTAGDGQSTPNLNGATIYATAATSPSTPQTNNSGVAQTPVQQVHGNGPGTSSMTPGAPGAFGRFAMR